MIAVVCRETSLERKGECLQRYSLNLDHTLAHYTLTIGCSHAEFFGVVEWDNKLKIIPLYRHSCSFFANGEAEDSSALDGVTTTKPIWQSLLMILPRFQSIYPIGAKGPEPAAGGVICATFECPCIVSIQLKRLLASMDNTIFAKQVFGSHADHSIRGGSLSIKL